ncbi:MAG: ATP synthase F1 subunit gamma [Acidimicrobiales bacterium]
MPGSQERILRRRVRSVEATKKITRAMELIAASQMVRARARISGSKPYLEGIEQVLADVVADGSAPARLMGTPESPEHVAVVAIVSDRGLCGGYNAFVLRTADRLVRTGEQAGRSYRLTTAGKKAVGYFRFRGRGVDDSFPMSDRPTYEDARRLAGTVVPRFMSGDVDLVQLVSTHFVSSGTQAVETRQLLPLEPPDGSSESRSGSPPRMAADGAAHEPEDARDDEGQGRRSGYFEYEPAAGDLLRLLVPRYAEAALYQALLEASASEHIARQRAMSAATENAEEMIKSLRRVMNRARQDTITTEIMEIVGGAEALRQGSGEGVEPTRHDHSEEQIA